MTKLVNCSTFHLARVSFNVARIHKFIAQECTKLDEQRNEVSSHFWKKDENGKRLEEQGPGSFTIPDECAADWQKEIKAIFDKTIEIDRPKLVLSEVWAAGLSPGDIMALEPILDCDEERPTLKAVE